ncbi:MAG TPA: DUF6364 family protein [Paludibacter sp.]|nr:DUF6364 family protein [Paludibacter sp.]
MNTKLTLNLDKVIIEEAKVYAKSNKLSLSKLIENYLHSLTYKKNEAVTVSPLVESLTGVISANHIEVQENYTDYLDQKYK